MVSDPAPFIAYLFLYNYEKRLIKDLQIKDLTKPRKLFNVFRFIDDLNTINDAGIFESTFRDTYLEELELSRENENNSEATFCRTRHKDKK